MVSCSSCNFDICRQCANEMKANMSGPIDQAQISGEWHGVTVEERPDNTVDL